jgi:signal transduction histidine kinase/ligand-binding sensor domain-containing protein
MARDRRTPSIVMLMICAAALLASIPARGLDADRKMTELHHTSFGPEQGAPSGIESIGQSTDGWLWLATRKGLFRFDGVTFEQVPLRPAGSNQSEGVATVWGDPAGGLWVGFASGGVVYLKGGKVRAYYDSRDGLPAAVAVVGFEQDSGGRVFAQVDSGLFQFGHGRWSRVDIGPGQAQSVSVDSIERDDDGALWAATSDGLYVLSPRAARFERSGVDTGGGGLAKGPDGTLWLWNAAGLRPLKGAAGLPRPHAVAAAIRAEAGNYLVDHDGAVWVIGGVGVYRLDDPAQVKKWPLYVEDITADRYGALQGLSSDLSMILFQDREGSIWVGSKGGLDRFRDNDFSVVHFPVQQVYFSLLETARGQVLAGTFNNSRGIPDRFWQLTPQAMPFGHFEHAVSAAYRNGASDVIWLGGVGHLWQLQDEAVHEEALPAAAAGRIIQAVVEDARQQLWISVRGQGVYRRVGKEWQPSAGLKGLPQAAASTMAEDPAGRLWLGYLDGTAALVDGNQVRVFTTRDGLHVGPVSALHVQGTTLVGGDLGLAVFDGQRFHAIGTRQDKLLAGVTGIILSKTGDLWINGTSGVVHLTDAEWRRAAVDERYPASARAYDAQDGYPGVAQQVRPLPTALAATDGRFWFAGSDGLAWLDPTHLHHNTLPPAVEITSLTVNDRPVSLDEHVTVNPGARDLRIGYTALSLVVPERVMFRYMLEGFDKKWWDGGSVRGANYANLDPGTYIFHVIASNNDGVWNETGASLRFTIRPAFTQSTLFKVLVGLGVLFLIWLLHLLRVRQITQRARSLHEERYRERARIARELHDTFLQSVQGIIFQFHALLEREAVHGVIRDRLEDTLRQAQEVVVEGRDRVQDLRLPSARVQGLGEALAEAASEFSRPLPSPLRLIVEGRPRPLDAIVQDEVYWIAREALSNAIRHAGSSKVEIIIVYRRMSFRIHVIDDGAGIDHQVLKHKAASGHWGIAGMRERAKRIDAAFTLDSQPGRFTKVSLNVPADVAYASTGRRWSRLSDSLLHAACRSMAWLRQLRRYFSRT